MAKRCSEGGREELRVGIVMERGVGVACRNRVFDVHGILTQSVSITTWGGGLEVADETVITSHHECYEVTIDYTVYTASSTLLIQMCSESNRVRTELNDVQLVFDS